MKTSAYGRRQHWAKKSISLMEHTMWGDIHISMAPLAQRSAIAWGRRAMLFCCQKSRGKCHTNANRLTEAAPKLPKFELCSVLKAVLKTCCCPPRQKKFKYLWQWLKLPTLGRVRPGSSPPGRWSPICQFSVWPDAAQREPVPI